MKALTQKQQDFLDCLPVGEKVDVATSEYSTSPIASTGWNPRTRYSSQGIKSLIKKGYLKGDVFWRGATVEKEMAR